MTDKPIGERVMAVEVSLREHLAACERKHEKNFRLLVVILGFTLTMMAKVFGFI